MYNEFVKQLKADLPLSEDEAITRIVKEGLTYRIRSRDGVGYMGTCDARHDRINLIIENDKVTNFLIG